MTSIIFIIIAINVIYVSFFTMRVILVIKGFRLFASLISMVEVFIYLMGLTLVLENLDRPLNIAAYCVGWALGVYLGSIIEDRLALGYSVLEVIIDPVNYDLASKIRNKGYGVTTWLADGKDGKRLVLKILAKRNNERKLRNFIYQESPNAFIIAYEPTQFNGGFLVGGFKTFSPKNNV